MSRFIETIRIEGGKVFNLEAHERRMNRTRKEFFPDCEPLELTCLLSPGLYLQRTRCRVVYERDIIRIEYLPYALREVSSLQCVVADGIDYSCKYEDRTVFNRLFEQKKNADDILIIRDNLLTDTSICNIALWDGKRWVTPITPLLHGTMRESLLSQGMIEGADITVANLCDYQKIRLFNSMIDFGEIELPVSAISKG